MLSLTHPRTGLALCAFASLLACDLPTGVPIYDTVWEVPGRTTSIPVNTLLPSGMQVTPDKSAFQVTVSPSSTTINQTLGQVCAACTSLNGLIVPKPAFVGGGATNLTLPSTLTSATLTRDTLTVSINNGFTFDPIRPSASSRGYLVILVRNGASIIGRDSLDGETAELRAGTTTTRKVPLSGTIDGSNGIQVVTTLSSPIGDPVAIDVTRALTLTGSIGTLFISQAQVTVANQNVSSAPSEIELNAVDSVITKRMNGGSLMLRIDNPFNVSGNLAVSFAGASMPIQKSLALAGGATTPSIAFTKDELKALMGRKVAYAFSGTVSGSSVTVSPNSVVSVSSRLQVVLTVGGK